MEPDGDLPLQGNGKGSFDEASYLSVGMVQCQRTEYDRQLGLSLANGADPPDDILHKGVQLGLSRHRTEGMHSRAANRYRRIGRSRENLKGQIADFYGLIRLRLPPHHSSSQEDRQGACNQFSSEAPVHRAFSTGSMDRGGPAVEPRAAVQTAPTPHNTADTTVAGGDRHHHQGREPLMATSQMIPNTTKAKRIIRLMAT